MLTFAEWNWHAFGANFWMVLALVQAPITLGTVGHWLGWWTWFRIGKRKG